MGLGAAHHTLAPPILDNSLRNLRTRPIEAIERTRRHIEIELCPVGGQRLAEAVKYFDRGSAGITIGLEHKRWNSADQNGFGDATLGLTILRNITRHFAAAGRMADMDGVLEVEMLGNSRSVGCIMVHVVTVADLRRTAMAASVVGDDAEALGVEEQHLRVPVVRAEGPTVMKDEGLTVAPILVIDFDAVLRFDKAHVTHSLNVLFGSRAAERRQTTPWPR